MVKEKNKLHPKRAYYTTQEEIKKQTELINEKTSQISNIQIAFDSTYGGIIMTTGVNDGMVNIIDMNTNKPIFSKLLHKAAINFIGTTKNDLLVTGSADRTIKIFDMTSGFSQIGELKTADAVFCGDICGDVLAVGCGDGNLLAYDLILVHIPLLYYNLNMLIIFYLIFDNFLRLV